MEKLYRLKQFIAILHSFDGDRQKSHAHTLEINCTVKTDAPIIDYRLVESNIKRCLDKYENKYLNDFDSMKEDATIENFGTVLCGEIDTVLNKINYHMTRFEIGETPLRIYTITDELRD